VGQVGGDEPFKLGDQLVRALRWEVEREQLDGDEPLAGRVVGAIDRPQRSRTNLMKNSEGSERVRGRIASSVSVQ
jgi:hypothetical protein